MSVRLVFGINGLLRWPTGVGLLAMTVYFIGFGKRSKPILSEGTVIARRNDEANPYSLVANMVEIKSPLGGMGA
jgi:hypothetical protein